MITEFVNFRLNENFSNDTLVNTSSNFIEKFLKLQAGFIDSELVYNNETKAGSFIIHYTDFDSIKAISDKMKNCKEFEEFRSIVVQGNINVSFNLSLKIWR